MKLLIVTNLFPNPAQPQRGLFNLQQIAALAKTVELRVVAPVPWAWTLRRRAAIPAEGTVAGIPVYYPRVPVVPVLSRPFNALLMWLALRGLVRRLARTWSFDRILATWAYPDVVAATWLGEAHRVPVVAKVHGSDLNVNAASRWSRRAIGGALRRCRRVICVSEALREKVAALGVAEEAIAVVPNGVDDAQFHPLEQAACRRQLGLPAEARLVLFVGNLVPVKGVDILLKAFRRLRADAWSDAVRLVVIGDGPQREHLARLADRLQLNGAVTFLGARPHAEIPVWLGACDVLCLPSRQEGCPNVVQEALAAGRPVVAAAVGGVPALLRRRAAGRLVAPRDPAVLAEGLAQALGTSWDPRAVREAAQAEDWARNAGRVADVLREADGIPIVYFGNDWFADNRTSSHHIAKRLATRHPVLYVETPGLRAPKPTSRDARKLWTKLRRTMSLPKRIDRQMWHLTMPQIPFRRLPGVRTANRLVGRWMVRRAMRHLGFTRPWLWFAVPHAAPLAGGLDERLLVYYCIDDYASLPDIDRREVARMDERLARAADQVFVSSPALLDSKHRLNPHTVYSPHGVDATHFGQALDPALPLADGLDRLPRPVIGFIGLMDAWVDRELLVWLAHERPAWTFLLIGRVAMDAGELRALPNVILPGPQPYETLPRWGKAFDVGIIPFRQTELVHHVNPLKLREYLAMGKPVVSVGMPELEQFNGFVRIARTHREFLEQLEAALRAERPDDPQRRQDAVAEMTWEARVDDVLELVTRRLHAREAELSMRTPSWQTP